MGRVMSHRGGRGEGGGGVRIDRADKAMSHVKGCGVRHDS